MQYILILCLLYLETMRYIKKIVSLVIYIGLLSWTFFVFAQTIIPWNIDNPLQVIQRLLVTVDGGLWSQKIADINTGGKVIFYAPIENASWASFLTTETDPLFSSSAAAWIATSQIIHWDNAFSRGNHALMWYLTAETDPFRSLVSGNYYTKNEITWLISGLVLDWIQWTTWATWATGATWPQGPQGIQGIQWEKW
jgi:hypothetical protein